MKIDKYKDFMFLLFSIWLWENKQRTEDNLFDVQDTGDLETSGAGTPSTCLISSSSTLDV